MCVKEDQYYQEDICIIHLSDLHIQSESEKCAVLTRNLKKLIEDMKKYVFSNECIIVVSGDTINMGDYSSVDIDTVLSFFKYIKTQFDKMNIVVKEIIFCPGNHDLDLRSADYDSLKQIMSKGTIPKSLETDTTKCTDINSAISALGYGEYLKLINKIRDVFLLDKISSPFYYKKAHIKEYVIHFIAIDFAWNQSSKEINNSLKLENIDNFNGLSIGKYQLESLRSDFQKEQSSESDMVIVVSHYPLSWLRFSDYQYFVSDLLSPSSFHANVYLCGHVHDTDAINYSTHEHSILTLVTGVGGKREKETWYSVYEINPIRNSCGIVVRKNKGDSDFVFDFSVYTKDRERETGKILYPLASPQKNLPYLRMNTPQEIGEKDYFISSEVSKLIPKIANCVSKVHSEVSLHFSQLINNLITEPIWDSSNSCCTIISDEMIEKYFTDELLSSYSKSEIRQFVESFLTDQVDENGNIIGAPEGIADILVSSWERYCLKESSFFLQGHFDSFMQEICDSYYTHLVAEVFPENISIRPHIRMFNKDNGCYICIAYPQNKEKPKDIKFGGLIEQAYKIHKPLIKSVNPGLNSISTKWQEFITVIPDFEGYELQLIKRDKQKKKKTKTVLPAVSFGISVKHCSKEQLYEATMIFAIFDYLNLQADLSHWIGNFDYYFGLPWKENE